MDHVEPLDGRSAIRFGDAGDTLAAPANDPGYREPVTSSRLIIENNPASIEAEAIRALRTRVVAQHLREDRRALAICTPSQGSGCSFIAANLAVSLAQIGYAVALVDADLRDGHLSELIGLDVDAPGLADYLADPAVTMDMVMQDEARPGLTFIGAGGESDNPQELLSGERFGLLIDQLLREFDITIFDTTPANSCTDAHRVASLARHCLLVARRHESYINDVAVLAKMLRADGAELAGTVLNQF